MKTFSSLARALTLACLVSFVHTSFSQTLYDSFSDGNFTSGPVWGGNTAEWTVVANSDAAAGATGSNTLRLNAPAVAATRYLSSQTASWGASQEWGFFMGRRAQAFTGANQQYFWLYANEANLTSATVDGYRIAIGDDSVGDELRLEYIVNGTVSATVITSSGSLNNGLTDIGFLVRVTRSSSGAWALFTSTLPTANGNGAIATDVPSTANTPVSQGTGTNNALVPAANGYLGVAALHTTGSNAIVTAEFDQIYFTPAGGAPTINGTIAANEYGVHTDGQNQQTNGGVVNYMTWDATNLYVGVSGANVGEGVVMYFDTDPQVPVNGGTNANGTNVGFNYDGANFAELQFRANLVLYAKNGYREYRTSNGSNGWSTQTAGWGSYADNGQFNSSGVREFSIPWTAFGGFLSSFNFFSYVTSASGFVFGEVPTENASGFIGTTARDQRYYSVSTTTVGSSTPPFSRNSYVFNSTASDNSFGAINVFDFTMNDTGLQIARAAGNWNITGTLVVNAGSVFFGSFGGPYGSTTVANVRVMGGQLDMDLSNQPMTVTGNVQTEPGGTIVESDTPGGDINVAGNFTHSGGYVANGRELRFNGTGVQTLSGTGTMILGNVVINNPTSVLLEGTLVVSGTLTLTNGILQLGNTTESFLSTTFPISGANASRYLRTTNGWLTQFVGPGFPGVFPVGVSAYNPITIEDVANFQSVFIRAIDGTVPGTLNNKTVNRYWRITTNDVTPLQISVNAQWNSGEESAGFTAGTVPYIGYFDGSSWSQVSATQTGSGPFQFSGGNFSEGPVTFTDFDYIALGKDNAFLPAPDITVTPTSLGFGFVASGGTSAQQPFNVSASNLSPASGNITVTPPANFEVSLTSGGPYSATAITIPYTGGNLSSTPVYVVFKPTGPPASYSANIAVSGGGAPSENAAVTGNSLPQVFQSFDTFDRANNAVIGIPSSGGAASWVEVEAGGSCTPSSTIIRIDNNQLELSNCNDGGTGSCGGSQYKAAMFDMTGKYATTYAQSGGVM
ncbi:MAG: hypothetical protein ACK5W1_05865, partial [Flavobacteriales bacterium]